MKLHKITDHEFAKYGRRLEGYDFTEFFARLSEKQIPKTGIVYEASDRALESCRIFSELRDRGFGGMPIQIGYVSADNHVLNCLEYHKSSEFNIALDEMILVLGLESEIVDGKFDTSKCEAFLVPAGEGVELFATTLHYAPFSAADGGYRVACVLPRGTNLDAPAISPMAFDDGWLYGSNKWIATLPGTDDAGKGVYVGLTGNNIYSMDIER